MTAAASEYRITPPDLQLLVAPAVTSPIPTALSREKTPSPSTPDSPTPKLPAELAKATVHVVAVRTPAAERGPSGNACYGVSDG